MKTSTLLKKAKRLISKREKWCKKHDAIDKKGIPVDRLGKNAFSFCMIGALGRANKNWDFPEAEAALVNVISSDIVVWNDEPKRTHEQVMAAFDKAIVLAEKEEK